MKNRVLLFLVFLLLVSFLLPFLSVAPNRVISAKGISLIHVLNTTQLWFVFAPVAIIVLISLVTPKAPLQIVVFCTTTLAIAAFFYLSGHYASLASQGSGLVRISFGSGFWLIIVILWFIAIDAVTRLTHLTVYRNILSLLVLLPIVGLLGFGQLEHLSILKEYSNNRVLFSNALNQHIFIITLTLLLTLCVGLPLGFTAFHHPRWANILLKALSVIQTIPSIALFGLLITPLAALSKYFPMLALVGIKGIGIAPAVIALTLYSLLPIVHATLVGLQNVPASVIEAAHGMGLTQSQILWKVQVRLALPVLFSGIRVTTVQTIGLAVVAALVGAGGYGAIIFRGLSGSSIDLVLLGVIPVIVLAICSDALFKIIVSLLEKKPT